MLRRLNSRLYVRWNRSVLETRSPSASTISLSTSLGIQNRMFWWSNDEKQQVAEEATAEVVKEDEKENKLVAQFGESLPKLSPLIISPLVRRPIFPGFFATHLIKDQQTIEAISANQKNGASYIGLFLRSDDFLTDESKAETITSADQLHNIGSFAQIHNIIKSPRGAQLMLMVHRRISLEDITNYGPPTIAKVTHLKSPSFTIKSPAIKAYSNEVMGAVRELLKINPVAQEHLHEWASRMDFSDPFKLADFAASMTSADGADLQRVLSSLDAEERLAITLELLNKEKEIAKMQKEISEQVEKKMSKQQREYLLREQLKTINKELGIEKDDKEDMLKKYKDRVEEFQSHVPKETLTVINDEIAKMASLERNSPEFNVTRSYLDWLTQIPWGKNSVDELDLHKAAEVLNSDHFGLEDVKSQILEFIAVGKLKGFVGGKILCLIGPPGVGKTSIAKSIANSLNRKFYRFSVGGLTDIAEIKGHRRTYIGAMPGKPIQCLKTLGYENPLILIDEIDKLGKGYQGDPGSALLELLDPNQNTSFVDHYLDVPVDFSRVLFVCTANDEGSIPGPLRDRMDIIRLSGYDIPEKVAIASRYLVPKTFHDAGLKTMENVKAEIVEDTLELIVKNYCRESGVRSLEKNIAKIARKIAYKAVGDLEVEAKGEQKPTFEYIVTPENLESYLGKPKYPQEALYDSKAGGMPPGVVMGLAWNPLGGSPVFIEAAATPTTKSEGSGGVNVVTGQLGNVMKESVNIAYTFSRQLISARFPENEFFLRSMIHIHVPEGAVEKDGPSAGAAMATALISLALKTPVRSKLAMTGELSLTGKVMPVGGIKEKILAARRCGADTIILPAANRRDFDELPQYVKDSVTIVFASEYDEVFRTAFGELNCSS